MRKLPSFWRYLADNVPYCSFFLYRPLPYILFQKLKISIQGLVIWFLECLLDTQNLDF